MKQKRYLVKFDQSNKSLVSLEYTPWSNIPGEEPVSQERNSPYKYEVIVFSAADWKEAGEQAILLLENYLKENQ